MNYANKYRFSTKYIVLRNIGECILAVFAVWYTLKSDKLVEEPVFVLRTLILLWILYGTISWRVVKIDQSLRNVAVQILSSAVILGFATAICHLIFVLYGAPFVDLFTETLHFAGLLATLCIFPGLCVLGFFYTDWVRVYLTYSTESNAEYVIFITTICSLLGAWFGAFPIPLDWDRPWQAWPVTCVVGSILGYVIGMLYATVRIVYSETVMLRHRE